MRWPQATVAVDGQGIVHYLGCLTRLMIYLEYSPYQLAQGYFQTKSITIILQGFMSSLSFRVSGAAMASYHKGLFQKNVSLLR